MKKVAVFIAAILVAVSAMAQAKEDVQVTPEIAAKCKEEGGCILISRKIVNALMQESYKEGITDTVKQLEGMTCKKASLV